MNYSFRVSQQNVILLSKWVRKTVIQLPFFITSYCSPCDPSVFDVHHQWICMLVSEDMCFDMQHMCPSNEQSKPGYDVSAGEYGATMAKEEYHSLLERAGQSPGASRAGQACQGKPQPDRRCLYQLLLLQTWREPLRAAGQTCLFLWLLQGEDSSFMAGASQLWWNCLRCLRH